MNTGQYAMMTDSHGYAQRVLLEECLDHDDQLFVVRFNDGTISWAMPDPEWGDLRPDAPEYEI